MKTERNWDFLKLLDKNEIIEFLKAEGFNHAPYRSSVVSFRYQNRLTALLKSHKELLESPDFVKVLPEIKVIEEKMEKITNWYEKNSEIERF